MKEGAQTKLIEIRQAAQPAGPLVVASPHSGSHYADDFLAQTRLSAQELRRSEDCHVNQIFAAAPDLGAPMIVAHFPRAFVDVNREPYELDPKMYVEALPDYANPRSPRVAAGFGTIARVVGGGEEIYDRPLALAEAFRRLESCYFPYHRALALLLDEARKRAGFSLLLDCHSMPSASALPDQEGRSADIVLGDCHGASAARALVELARDSLRGMGYRVALNLPYAGGFVTRHYGRPEASSHALQIEISRSLYMDEKTFLPKPSMTKVSADMTRLLKVLSGAGALARAAE